MPIVIVAVVAFVFGFVGSMSLAGPIAVLIVSASFEKRYRDAIKVNLGCSIVEALYASIAFVAFSALIARDEKLVPVARAVTAVIFLAVGLYFVRWKQKKGKRSERKSTFLVGLGVSVVNPTPLVSWSAAVAWVYGHGFVRLQPALAIPWGLAATAGVSAWNFTVIALIRKYQDRFPHHAITWVVRAMGFVLIGLAVWSAVELFLKKPM